MRQVHDGLMLVCLRMQFIERTAMANSFISSKTVKSLPEGASKSSFTAAASPATQNVSPPKTLHLLSAAVIDPGNTPNRVANFLNDEEFEKLAESISHSRGNQEPIQVRPLKEKDGAFEFALISGARRLHACLRHSLPVLAVVVDITPAQALIQRLVENNLREPLCPWELGVQIAHIRSQATSAPSVRELANLIGIDKSMVQKALDIATLPQQVVNAFTKPRDIRYSDSKVLKDLVAQSPDEVIQVANTLKGAGLLGKHVVERLTQAVQVAKEADAAPTVEPFNMPQKMPLQVDGKEVGVMQPGKFGQLHITLNAYITHAQQLALAQQLERFVARKILQSKETKPVSETMKEVPHMVEAANAKSVKKASKLGFGNEEAQA